MVDRLDSGTGQPLLGPVQYSVKHILLALASGDERHFGRMVNNWVGECNALWGRLGRIFDVRNPSVLLLEELVPWEQRHGVSVWPHAKEDKVEHGKARGVFGRKLQDKLPLVRISELLQVVEQRWVNCMHVAGRNCSLGVELCLAKVVVGVRVI